VIAIENVRLFEEVQERTRELTQSVGELRALGEVSQAVNSTLDLQGVLDTIVAKATQLSGTEAGAIYVFDDADQEFRLRATYGSTMRWLPSSEIVISASARRRNAPILFSGRRRDEFGLTKVRSTQAHRAYSVPN
jgi:GAF domain-containing protein